MSDFLDIFLNKIYKISQKIIDILLFFPFPRRKKSILSKQISKYGFLKIFPEKKSYFNYISSLSNQLNLNDNLKSSKNIISIGTCFAEQVIQYYGNLHSIVEKTNTNNFGFAADWGRVTSLEHLFRLTNLYKDGNFQNHCKIKTLKDFNDSSKNLLISSFRNKSETFDLSNNQLIIDTSREHLKIYSSKNEFSDSILSHINFARKAIKKSDTIFITLGQTGYFIDSEKTFYAIKPPSDFMQIESIKFIDEKINSFAESVNKLENCLENLRILSNNPKFFISLSPVPAFAYFGINQSSVLEYHWYSKSFLYHVINQVVKNDSSLNYIPTFESIMSLNLTTLNDDLRHLKPWFRSKIFNSLFT